MCFNENNIFSYLQQLIIFEQRKILFKKNPVKSYLKFVFPVKSFFCCSESNSYLRVKNNVLRQQAYENC